MPVFMMTIVNCIKNKISLILNTTLLSIAYFLGVGITFIFSKLLSKNFLDHSLFRSKKSSFVVFNNKSNLEKMF